MRPRASIRRVAQLVQLRRNHKPGKFNQERCALTRTSNDRDVSEKKLMSRLVPDTAGARMADVSTVQLEILEARG
jgi:hypothetical protein